MQPTHDAAKSLALRMGTAHLVDASHNGSPALDRHGVPIEPRKLSDSDAAMVYQAPEAFVPGAACAAPADIYALGWLMYELHMREQTFQAARFRDQVRSIGAFIDLYTIRGARYERRCMRLPVVVETLCSLVCLSRADAVCVNMLNPGPRYQARASPRSSQRSSPLVGLPTPATAPPQHTSWRRCRTTCSRWAWRSRPARPRARRFKRRRAARASSAD